MGGGSLHYNTEYGVIYNNEEHVSEIPRNIILVGTKSDLCKEGPKTKRQV